MLLSVGQTEHRVHEDLSVWFLIDRDDVGPNLSQHILCFCICYKIVNEEGTHGQGKELFEFLYTL